MLKKRLVSAALIIMGVIGIAACASAKRATPASSTSPDQMRTSASIKATVEVAFPLTEEANTLLESAISASETRIASLATDTPISFPTPTPPPTPVSTPTSTPMPYYFPFNNTMPIQWEDKGDDNETTVFVVQIEKIVANGFFSGYLLEPEDGVKYRMSGKIVDSFDEYELGKWEQIEGFEPDLEGTWIHFTKFVIEGNCSCDQLFLAHINEEGDMSVIYFWNKNTFDPFGSFELSLSEQ